MQEIDLKDLDTTSFEKKVYLIADEVLTVLKELSRENQKQINSKTIAEKMFLKDSVKTLLAGYSTKITNDNAPDLDRLKEIANSLLDKLAGIVPDSLSEDLNKLKNNFHEELRQNASDGLESPINVIKKYIDSLAKRNTELEDFLKQNMQYLRDIDKHFADQLTSQQQKSKDDRDFEDGIYDYANMMRQECNLNNDINTLKAAFLSKLEHITQGIEQKREKDILRVQETEMTIEQMRLRMVEIKREAEAMKKRAEEAESISYRDNLTGLHNRRAYDDRVAETLANVQRYNISASLMICDIDFFKKINDNLGHKVGDLALKKLADLLVERLRKNDFIARYGGEEFVILLPHTDLQGAANAGEGIRAYIDKSVFSYKNQKIPLTISVGISAFRKEDDVNAVFERADHALYLAKRTGRNRVKTENDIGGPANLP
ncbi:MAG: GGDEF domain-containing protein [Nitrospiraceae bacterium]|nr:MAG: GGDEF domain-containing protein [Nitrospiraceae bacterium]